MKLHATVATYSNAGTFQKTSDELKKYAQFQKRIIAIEGPIGAGKTTLGQSMAAVLNQMGIPAVFLEEKYNSDFLELFCKSPKDYAFSFQMSMLNACQHNYLQACHKSEQVMVVIVDRTIWGNAVFAALHVENGNITAEEFKVYCSCMNQYGPYRFDHVIYLDIDSETSLNRIAKRGRHAEKSYTAEYLQSLEMAYYTQIYAQMTTNHSNITVLSNDVFYEARSVFDAILYPQAKDGQNFVFPGDVSPDKKQLTYEDVRKGFELLTNFFSSS